MTAIGVAFFMGITGVKMPMVWAVLAFIFNFIPNVGSMLATIMPLPIILVDSELTMFWKVLGFALPAVWNACERRNGRLGPLTVACCRDSDSTVSANRHRERA